MACTLFQGCPAAPSSRLGRTGVGDLDGPGHLGEILIVFHLQLRECFLLAAVTESAAGAGVPCGTGPGQDWAGAVRISHNNPNEQKP